MSLPPFLPIASASDADWKRKVATLLNLTVGRTMGEGPTSERPPTPSRSMQFYDTSLSKPVWWDGATWRDAMGNAV